MRELTVAVTVRRGISKRSHEKIGDCEQSIGKVSGNPKLHCELRYFHFTGSLSVSCQERCCRHF